MVEKGRKHDLKYSVGFVPYFTAILNENATTDAPGSRSAGQLVSLVALRPGATRALER